jgi:hypothetical protein
VQWSGDVRERGQGGAWARSRRVEFGGVESVGLGVGVVLFCLFYGSEGPVCWVAARGLEGLLEGGEELHCGKEDMYAWV